MMSTREQTGANAGGIVDSFYPDLYLLGEGVTLPQVGIYLGFVLQVIGDGGIHVCQPQCWVLQADE